MVLHYCTWGQRHNISLKLKFTAEKGRVFRCTLRHS
ncbi:unnamed protein product [Rhodiola kirilowii]